MKNPNMPFGPKNYRMLLISLGVMMLGFILMASDKEEFGFGMLGLTVGPLVLLAGFLMAFVPLLIKDSEPDSSSEKTERR